MLCVKNMICTETTSMTFHMLGVPSAEPCFERNGIVRFVIRWSASVDRADRPTACFAGKLVHCHLNSLWYVLLEISKFVPVHGTF